MLTHAIADVMPGVVAAADILLVLGFRVVRRRQVGRAADQLGDDLGQGVEHRAGGLPRRNLGILFPEFGTNLGDRLAEPGRQLTALAPQEFSAAFSWDAL